MIDEASIVDNFPFTDTGNAERLVATYGDSFRWLTDEETFAVWDGTVWKKDPSGNILLPLTKRVIRAMPDADWSMKSESAMKRKAMITLAKGEEKVFAARESFDQRPMLLNVMNGTIDLETEQLREFSREDYLTKKARVTYDAFASAPKFDQFMRDTFGGDEDLIHYILKALGYTLTGLIGESCFFICHGLGQNGKTTLLEIVMQILGLDYATVAAATAFMEQKFENGSAEYERASWAGSRLLTNAEPKSTGRLNEDVLKRLSGGEAMKARVIRQSPFTFYPECKLWLALNKKPRIVGTDDGIWRRVRFIPFMHKVPDDKKVRDFHKVLFAEEGPGILNRLLEGLSAWQSEGLKSPSAVAAATAEFRATSDTLDGFFATRCLTGKHSYWVECGKLYEAYQQWAEDMGEYVMRSQEFSEELDRRQFIKKRGDTGQIRRMITLKDAVNESSPDTDLFDAA